VLAALVVAAITFISLHGGNKDGERTFHEWTVRVDTGTDGTAITLVGEGHQYEIEGTWQKEGNRLYALKSSWAGAIRCMVHGNRVSDCQKTGDGRMTFTLRGKTASPFTLTDPDNERVALEDGKRRAADQYAELEVGRQVSCTVLSRIPARVTDCEPGGPGVVKPTSTIKPVPAVGTAVTAAPPETPTTATPRDAAVHPSVREACDRLDFRIDGTRRRLDQLRERHCRRHHPEHTAAGHLFRRARRTPDRRR
jgi:hypothetical protein